jgi:ADP-ribose pyrophosphatase YjhB (NUDIX family)
MSEKRPGSDAVEDLLGSLRSEYESVDVVEKSWQVTTETYDRTRERIAAGGGGGAGIWVTNDDGEVLLVRNEGDEGWGDPGGKVDPGESFETGAKRETREEAGVDARITGLNEVHLVAMYDENDPDRPALLAPIVVFDGEYVGGDPRPREGEIAAVEWFEAAPDEVLYEEVATRRYPASE